MKNTVSCPDPVSIYYQFLVQKPKSSNFNQEDKSKSNGHMKDYRYIKDLFFTICIALSFLVIQVPLYCLRKNRPQRIKCGGYTADNRIYAEIIYP